jgi:hypothetical protein
LGTIGNDDAAAATTAAGVDEINLIGVIVFVVFVVVVFDLIGVGVAGA